MDDVLEAPVIQLSDKKTEDCYQTECFLTQGGSPTYPDKKLVVNDYKSRLKKYKKDSTAISKNAYAGICPDFLLN